MTASNEARPATSRFARYVALWDAREPATALALLRITIAGVIAYDLVYLAALGLVEPLFGDAWEGHLGHSMHIQPLPLVLELFGRGGPFVAYAGALITTIAFGAGALTRLSGVLMLFFLVQLQALYPTGDRGIEQMLRLNVAILVLSQSHATLSVDARWRHGAWARPNALVPAWPRYLVLVQLVWMYTSAGLSKSGAEWAARGGYMALFYVLRYQHFVRWDLTWVPAWPTQIGTFLTLWFELLAPLALYAAYRGHQDPGRTRRSTRALGVFRAGWTVIGLGLHTTLLVIMNIGIFTTGMLALYLAWISPRTLRRAPWRALRYEDGEPPRAPSISGAPEARPS